MWSRRLKPGRGRRGRWLPRLWLVSDPVRLPDPGPAAARLPRGAGVLARGLPPDRLRWLALLARRRGLVLLVGDAPRAALALRCGLHLPDRAPGAALLPYLRAWRAGAPWAVLSLAVHGRRALARARRLRPDLGLVSPAFPTASHPGAPALGPPRWAALARALGRPAAALGGVAPGTAGRLPSRGAGRACALAAIGGLAGNRAGTMRRGS